MRIIILRRLALALAGLGTLNVLAASAIRAETLLLADIRRVVETKDQDGKVRRTEEPIESKPKDSDDSQESHWYAGSSAGPISISGPTGMSPLSGDGFSKARSFSAGYSASHVFHTLTTHFTSPSFTRLSWNTVPEIHGSGAELAFHPLELDLLSLGVRGGFFQNSASANAQQEGSLYVKERIKTTGGWADLEAQTAPFYGFSLLAGIGGLTYSVDTHVETNAPIYTYEGLTGSRTVMIYGLGGQFEAPWKFFIKPYIQGRYWWTAGAGDPQENGAGQFSAGLVARF